MSEAVSNAEIEGVLSAVRRLVSEQGATSAPKPEAKDTSKLVLTPAFRVDEAAHQEAAAEAPAPEEAQAQPVAATPEAEAIRVETAPEMAPEMAPEIAAETDADEAPISLEVVPEASEEAHAAEVTPLHPVSPNADAKEQKAALEARLAELEALIMASPDDDVHISRPEAMAETPEALAQEVEEDEPQDAMFHHHVAEERAQAEAEAVVEGDQPEIAAHEAPQAEQADEAPEEAHAPAEDVQEWEDVALSDDTEDGFEEDIEDVMVEVADVAPEAPASDVFTDPDYASEEGGDLVIDEDMLREIVSRLVREELQGTMGERITRNLRRMVRREIAKALALKDYE